MRQVTNPLTGENLAIRPVVNEVVDSACLDVLRALDDLPAPADQADIGERSSTSRQTASTHLTMLQDRGFIKRHEGGIEPTAGGRVLLKTIEECLEEDSKEGLTREELAYLTRSEHPLALLLALSEGSRHPNELQAAASSSPSRSTVNRTLEWFADHDWSRDGTGRQHITSAGKETLFAYDELAAAIEQLIEKAVWLQRLPPDDATFPVRELTDATVITSDTGHPSSVLWAALKLFDPRISRFRTLCSIYNPILFHTYRAMLDFDIEADAILDWSTYVQASRNHQTHYAVDDSTHPNYQPLYLEESHTLGIGIYDDRKVAVGAYNERGSGKHIAMIVSSNEAIVEWGEQLYDSYREIARRPDADPSR